MHTRPPDGGSVDTFSRRIPLIVATAFFMETLDGTIVATALPAMAQSLGETPLSLTASITVYLVAMTVFVPTAGWASDRFGARRTGLLGLALIAVFSAAAMVRVPYFASIVPHVVRMEPGYAEVTVPKWFFVYNHLHTVHAIASCNAAEIAMGMLMEATVPTSHRWIPKAMNVQYLQKATTALRARARLEPPDFESITDGVELVVPVSVVDKSATEVVHADITCWVTPAV